MVVVLAFVVVVGEVVTSRSGATARSSTSIGREPWSRPARTGDDGNTTPGRHVAADG
jgi:hypothetical protein